MRISNKELRSNDGFPPTTQTSGRVNALQDTNTHCYHCGQSCEDADIWFNDKPFCCEGCRNVYDLLESNNLCEYYDISEAPGAKLEITKDDRYDFLDQKDIRKKLLQFEGEAFAKVSLFIPLIHCASCIWLLENLQRLDVGILRSEVNFGKKTVSIDFNPQKIKLSALAQRLSSLGYAPNITLNDKRTEAKADYKLPLKIAVAGFCFGNIMLFSFPEYLGADKTEGTLMAFFSALNLLLAIPVFFFSGFEYVRSAYKSFQQKQLNIDVPIAAGLIALFFRSTYDIMTATGPGYLDSFSGLVFFLLIGRWFQNKTYESLSFDRDFTSYFPLAVNKSEGNTWKPIVIYKLEKGDRIKIRNMELVPADSILQDAVAFIDYSFVTGEARPVKSKQGEMVYAGGRVIGAPAEFTIEKKTSQSHLTSLWNNSAFRKSEESKYQKIIDRAARKFTWIVMGIALCTAIYWSAVAPDKMLLTLTCVLMVACPCSLALAAPFTLGSMLRVFGRNQLYLKNVEAIERMAGIDAVVFDKTGTITHGSHPEVIIEGDFEQTDLQRIKLLTSYSTHPLSIIITHHIKRGTGERMTNFREFAGKGIEGKFNGTVYRVGSADFADATQTSDPDSTQVFISVDHEFKGTITIKTAIRKNISDMLERLGNKCYALLSGDHNTQQVEMQRVFPSGTEMKFEQSPQDKLDYVRGLQHKGRKVMMIGDGLNDAGALKQSDVGIAITDDTGVFTPACDGILLGEKISSLDKMIAFSKSSSVILKTGFTISFFYNAIALTFAVTGHLTPLVAAVIMPISSISVVGFSTLAVKFSAARFKL